jgi:hypothetical protein
MKILVTGDRNWKNIERITMILEQFAYLANDVTLVHGYATGADEISHAVVKKLKFNVIPCPAHWNHYCKRYIEIYGECSNTCKEICGRSAGIIRNIKMFDIHKPYDYVMAFHNSIEKSKETKHMVNYVKKHKSKEKIFLLIDNTISRI